VAALAIGLRAVRVEGAPSLTLAILGRAPLAGLAIERLLDLDAILPQGCRLAEFRPTSIRGRCIRTSCW